MASPKKDEKRETSPCALFVKKMYPSIRGKFERPQERIRHIAELWREQKNSNQEPATKDELV